MIVDSHCHLDFPQLAEQESEVVARAVGGRRAPDGDDRHAA